MAAVILFVEGSMVAVIDQVRQTIEQNGLLAAGETVVVGVSGGPDSLCLLHVLWRLAGEYGLALHAAHLHHGQRGAEADADAEFVRGLAAEWGLACTVAQVDVPALAREQRLAFEEAARRARYAFLSRVAAETGARTIAVGHNADDQAETVLMHFLRGSGLAGLRGMLPRTPLADYRLLDLPSPGFPDSEAGTAGWRTPLLIRPLLEVPRADILDYCARHGLAPRFDRSNLDTTYFRNWLRHEVIPLLAQHNPNVREVMGRTARVIAADYDLLREVVAEVWERVVVEEAPPALPRPARGRMEGERIVFDLDGWRALPTAMQRATLREAIHRLRRSLRNINFVHVENALRVARDGASGDQATLPQGLMLTVGYERLTMGPAGAAGPLPDWPLLDPEGGPLPVRVPGTTPLPGSGWALTAELRRRDELLAGWEANADPWLAFLDAEALGPAPLLRTRQPGDRFQPLGLGGHSTKLADFLTNQKVSHAVRDRLPLLVGEVGIAWVCGQRPDGRARVQEATEQVVVLRFARQ
jgi:tRNA(Ile)-lysidine synthase